MATLKAGLLRALAVSTGRRLPALPNVPTFAEPGCAKLASPQWLGLSAPKGLPAPIAQKPYSLFPDLLARPDMMACFEALQTMPCSPNLVGGDFVQMVKSQADSWRVVARAANVEAAAQALHGAVTMTAMRRPHAAGRETAMPAATPAPAPAAAPTAATSTAAEVVGEHLRLVMIPDPDPDPDSALRCTAPGMRIRRSGGRPMKDRADTVAFNMARYQWVKKRLERTETVGTGTPIDAAGDTVVYSLGTLCGPWPDGAPFEGSRCLDRCVARDGLIVGMDVWNDSAEWMLVRAGMAVL